MNTRLFPMVAVAFAMFLASISITHTSAHAATTRTPSGSIVVYTPDPWYQTVEDVVATYWRQNGYTVTTVGTGSFSSNPDVFRSQLKSDIATRAASGAFYFHLVGDANDYVEFGEATYSPMWASQAWEDRRDLVISNGANEDGQGSFDFIPTWYVLVPGEPGENMTSVIPYYHSDALYADTIGDDQIPDVVVTRWPVRTSDEIVSVALKMQYYNTYYDPMGQIKSIGMVNYNSPLLPSWIRQLYAEWLVETESYLEPFAQNYFFSIGAGDQAEVLQLYNNYVPEILLISGLESDRYRPGEALLRNGTTNLTMNDITPYFNHFPVVVAPTCRTANFAHTEEGYGRPIGEEFVVAGDRGAICWIGPTEGSWQTHNQILATKILAQILENRERNIAESWLMAIREFMQERLGDPQSLLLAQSYVYLGDPYTKFSPLQIIVSAEDVVGAGVEVLNAYPNPFNPEVRVRFRMNRPDVVRILVYDVRGRMIKKICESVRESGEHSVAWRGESDLGGQASSGVYFIRISIGDMVEVQKITLAK